MWDTGKYALGTIAHAAGNLIDVARMSSPQGMVESIATPEDQTYASRFSAPFATPNDRYTQLDPDQQELHAKVNQLYNHIFGTGPAATLAKRTIPQVAEAAGTASGIASVGNDLVAGAESRAAASQIEEGHPLTDVAKSEQAGLDEATASAKGQGLKLPDTDITPAQRWVNQSAREDLDLPDNAPVTPGMVDGAIKNKVETNYGPARAVPQYRTGPQYEEALQGVDLTKIDPKVASQLTSGTMDGKTAVSISQELRDTARGLYEDAENRNQPYRARQVSRAEADANYNAAKAVEAGLSEANPEAGQLYQEGRVYIAKANTYRNALDGAGNVIAPKLAKGLLKDEPFTGQMATIAKVAQMNPREFQSTRIPTSTPSLVRRGAAAAAPAAGAAIGGAVGGPWGAGAGEIVGRHLGENILNH